MTSTRLRRIGLLLALLTAGGCTRTIYYAVIAPNVAMDDGHSCFRQCQMLRAAGTKQYLGCLNTCPDVRVVNESECREVAFDARQYDCTTEHNQTFSPGPGIAAIFGAVLLFILIGVMSEQTSNNNQ